MQDVPKKNTRPREAMRKIGANKTNETLADDHDPAADKEAGKDLLYSSRNSKTRTTNEILFRSWRLQSRPGNGWLWWSLGLYCTKLHLLSDPRSVSSLLTASCSCGFAISTFARGKRTYCVFGVFRETPGRTGTARRGVVIWQQCSTIFRENKD